MKAISIWQPFAQLIVEGYKLHETRSWTAPKSVLGGTIAICSTKNITPAQRLWVKDNLFAMYYARSGLPELDQLPLGYVLGTATVHASHYMDEDLLDDVTAEEKCYGHWDIGNYAWELRNVKKFHDPIPVVGKQGIFDWNEKPASSNNLSLVRSGPPAKGAERERNKAQDNPKRPTHLRLAISTD